MTEAQEALIAELRSGRHQQTRGKLEDSKTGAKCCLGVACWLASEAGVCKRTMTDLTNRVYYDRHDAAMPQSVQEYFGFKDDVGGYGSRPGDALTQDNDRYKHTFAQIADTIASNPEGMFV